MYIYFSIILVWILSEIAPSSFLDLVAVTVFLFFLVSRYRSDPSAFITISPILITHFAALISIATIGLGLHIFELGLQGGLSSATASYALYNMLFVDAAMLSIQRSMHREESVKPEPIQWMQLMSWCTVVVMGLLILYVFFKGAQAGFPLLTGTDRFVFRSMVAGPIVLNVLNLKFVLAAMLGVVFSTSKPVGIIALVEFLIMIPMYFLFGDKFFTVLCFSVFFLCPLFVNRPAQANRLVMALTPVVSALVACLFAITIFIYSDYGTQNIEVAFIKLGERIVAQGQLWYIFTISEAKTFAFNATLIYENILSIWSTNTLKDNFESRIGSFYFADNYASYRMLDSMNRNEGTTSFTMAFEAYAGVMFGYAGLVPFMLLAGYGSGKLISYFRRSARTFNAIEIVAPAFLFTLLWNVLNQGTINVLFSLVTLKQVAPMLFLILMLRLSKHLLMKPAPKSVQHIDFTIR